MEVDCLDIDDDRVRVGAMPSDHTEKLSEREDEITIEKTKAVIQNFMNNLYRVIPQILADQHRSGEKSKKEIHLLEAGIKRSTLEIADHHGDLGWNGIKSTALVMGASLLQFIPGCSESDKMIANTFAKE